MENPVKFTNEPQKVLTDIKPPLKPKPRKKHLNAETQLLQSAVDALKANKIRKENTPDKRRHSSGVHILNSMMIGSPNNKDTFIIPTHQLLMLRQHIKSAEEALRTASRLHNDAKRTPILEKRVLQLENQLSTTISELNSCKHQLEDYRKLSKIPKTQSRKYSSISPRYASPTRSSSSKENDRPISPNFRKTLQLKLVDSPASISTNSSLNDSIIDESNHKFTDLKNKFEDLISNCSRPVSPTSTISAKTAKTSLTYSSYHSINRSRPSTPLRESPVPKVRKNTSKTSFTQTLNPEKYESYTQTIKSNSKTAILQTDTQETKCASMNTLLLTDTIACQTENGDDITLVRLNIKDSSIEEGFISMADTSPGSKAKLQIRCSSPLEIPNSLSSVHSEKFSHESTSRESITEEMDDDEIEDIDSYDLDQIDEYLKNTSIDSNKVYLMKQWEDLAQSNHAKYIDKFVSRMSTKPDSLLLVNDTGDTPLHFAVVHSNFSMLSSIFEHYPSAEISDVFSKYNKLGFTPYLIACALLHPVNSDEIQIVKTIFGFPGLSSQFSKPTEGNPFTKSPLLMAASYGNQLAVEILIQLDSEIDYQDEQGNTPLILATQNDHQTVVQILINNFADDTLKTHDGKTAFKIAVEKGFKNIAILLYNYGQK